MPVNRTIQTLILTLMITTIILSAVPSFAAEKASNLSFKIKKHGIVYYEGTIQAVNKQTVVKSFYEPIPYTSELILYSQNNNKLAVGNRNRSAVQEGYKLSVTVIDLMDKTLYVSLKLEVKEITNWIKLPTGKLYDPIYQPEVNTTEYESSLMALVPNITVNSNKTFANTGEPIPNESLQSEKSLTLDEIEHGYAVEFMLANK